MHPIDRTLLRWALAGSIVVFCAGSSLHFVFDLSGRWPPLALIAAVNESVWEHCKLAFWPMLAFAGLERWRVASPVAAFWPAAGFGLLTTPVVIAVVFYAYTSAFGRNLLAVDISLFFVASAAGQYVNYRLMVAKALPVVVTVAGRGVLVALVAAFLAFTYCPPRAFLFEDGRTHGYGIAGGE